MIAKAFCPIWREEKFHEAYSSSRLRGEWFNLSETDIAAIMAKMDRLERIHGKPEEKMINATESAP